MSVPARRQIKPGLKVAIVLKQDQRTGRLTEGLVADLLTKSPTHPHGIKVRLTDGQVGRVQKILSESSPESARAAAYKARLKRKREQEGPK